MTRSHRVGTLTLGASLIVFGVLFLINRFTSVVSSQILMMLWPLILVFLGIEIILSYIFNKNEYLKYDGAAIALIIVLTLFCLVVSGGEYLIDCARSAARFYY